jgi:hypothetical protein
MNIYPYESGDAKKRILARHLAPNHFCDRQLRTLPLQMRGSRKLEAVGTRLALCRTPKGSLLLAMPIVADQSAMVYRYME